MNRHTFGTLAVPPAAMSGGQTPGHGARGQVWNEIREVGTHLD
jgi:hypothetical protein